MAKKIDVTTDADTELSEIRDQAKECVRLRGVWEECKEQTKQARDDYDSACDHLQAMCLDAERPMFNEQN